MIGPILVSLEEKHPSRALWDRICQIGLLIAILQADLTLFMQSWAKKLSWFPPANLSVSAVHSLSSVRSCCRSRTAEQYGKKLHELFDPGVLCSLDSLWQWLGTDGTTREQNWRLHAASLNTTAGTINSKGDSVSWLSRTDVKISPRYHWLFCMVR